MDGDAQIEHVLFNAPEVNVYRIPPRVKAGPVKCAEWTEHLATLRIKIIAKGRFCTIILEDPKTNQVFATCPVRTEGPETVERVSDSSRYFILRLEDGTGHHAFIGAGFEERSAAFDFLVALQDHQKYVRSAEDKPAIPKAPAQDFALKQGQKIHVNLKRKKKDNDSHAKTEVVSAVSLGAAPPKSEKKAADDWTDFSSVGDSLF